MGFLVLLKVFAGFLYWFYIIGFTMGFLVLLKGFW